MLQVVHAMKDPPLVGFQHLPKYEFVQDIEETPDVAIQESTKFWALVSNPVDSFWFFELDSPKVEKKLLDLSHLGATATIETSTTGFVNNQLAVPSADLPSADAQVPIAVPGTYQLFLPDPEMMNRLGEVPPRAEIYQAEQNNKPTIPIEHPSIPAVVPALQAPVDKATPTSESHATSEVVQQLCRLSRSSSKKRVVIADPPVSGSQSPPRSKSRKLYSYQRPRSPSFTTRLLTATQRVNSTYSERKTMENLTASMKSASELLERRRAARSSVDNTSTTSTSGTSTTSTSGTNTSTSRYVPDSNPERGRASTRYQVPTVPTEASSSYRSDTSNASSGASLWGLLDMAQSWIMKSRRDRSEEKSRYLIRKTRQF